MPDIFGNSTSHSQSHNSVDYRDVRLVLDTGASKTLIIPNAILGLGYDLSNPKYIELIFIRMVLNLIVINRNKVYRHENAFLLCRFCLTFIA